MTQSRTGPEPLPSAQPSLPAGQPQASDIASLASAIEHVVRRLDDLIDREIAVIQASSACDLQHYTNRKSECLLELVRLSQSSAIAAACACIEPALASLRSKLEANARLQRVHIQAVQELTDAISEAVRDAESDGTYSRQLTRHGGRT